MIRPKLTIRYRQLFFSFVFLMLGQMSLPQSLYAQESVIDSLNVVLSEAKDDITRIKVINNIAFQISKDNSDSAYYILQEVLPKAEAIGNLSLLIELYYTKGIIYSNRQQYDSTILIMERVKSMAIEIKDYEHISYSFDEIGKAYQAIDQDELAIQNLKEGLAIALKHQLDFAEYKSANNLGDAYTYMNQPDSAEVYLKKALETQIRKGDKEEQAKVLANLGINADHALQQEKALSYFKQSLFLMEEIGNRRALAIIYRAVASSYYSRGDYTNALDNFQKSFAAVEGTQHYSERITSLDFLSDVYLTIEDFDNALFYLERAYTIGEEAFGQNINSELSFKRGKILLLRKDHQAAKYFLLESLELKKEAGQFIHGRLYQSLGQCYELFSQIDSATLFYQNAINVAAGSNNYSLHAQNLSSLADIYFFQEGKTQQAQNLYLEAYNIANKAEIIEGRMDAAKGLYFTNKKQNNFKAALQYLEITKAIQDSLFNEKNTKEITQIQADYEFEKEKEQLAFKQETALEEEANKRRLLWLALAAVGLVLLIGASYFYNNQKANKKLQKLNDEISTQKTVVESQAKQLSLSLEELQQKNELIVQAQNQLIQQEKLASLGQLTAGISHEIKNPLNFINNFSEDSTELLEELDGLLKDVKAQLPSDKQRLIQSNIDDLKLNIKDVLQSGLRLDQIVNNMMNHTRESQLIQSKEDLNNLLDININFAFNGFKSSNNNFTANIIKDFDPDLPLVKIYPQELGRVILNLINNACYATHLKTQMQANYTPEINVSTQLEQDQFKVIVRDNGVGIPEAILENIFNPFFTTKPTGEGNTGLGLSISFDVISNLHKGQLLVESEEGLYTEFILLLPLD